MGLALQAIESAETPRIKQRVENLSDLVFGLALSIGSIILVSKLPSTSADLVNGVVLFGFSFLIVVWIWTGYTAAISELQFEVPGTLALNIALLYCVAIEPYLFYVVTQNPANILDPASAAYGIDIGAMLFILAGLVRVVLGEAAKRGSSSMPAARVARYKRAMRGQIVAGAIFAGSALPFFWITSPVQSYVRFDMWYLAMAVLILAPRLKRGRSR